MLDQIYGKPSSSWKRTQVLIVLLFWISRIVRGSANPSFPLLKRLNKALSKFSPWQIIISTLTTIYAIKNSDKILGLQAPEPLARLYHRNYYRATWIVTALDAGFATAMSVKPKWARDILSVAFSGYYLIFAHEADEKLRKYRALCTVEMLRTTWEKQSNPYIRFATRGDRPKIGIRKKILLPRPKGSSYSKPITAWLFFYGTEAELAQTKNLIFDLPGGGFICMTPEHHEERLIRWTKRTQLPCLSFDYGKAPEYPFPFAINEAYDAYKLLFETQGRWIGMSGKGFNIVMTGDSAGANIAAATCIKILETKPSLPLPVSLVFAYPALDFNFTSWMSAANLKVLRQESSADIASILRDKEHLQHRSPLAIVSDVERPRIKRRRSSWGRSFVSVRAAAGLDAGEVGDDEADSDEYLPREEKDKTLSERVLFSETYQAELLDQVTAAGEKVLRKAIENGPLETRLAMTSRTAFFSDRIISPPMCRAMALLYIGPRNAPDLHSDYHISPIFTPANLLAQFPPVYLSCGERDPFVDDTVILAGKLREAKEARKLEVMSKQAKFGESLRMSNTSTPRDPILDEDEDDWVQMNIIEGWSHGYLQMISLLPDAVHAIDMLADWITTSFEKHDAKHPTLATPPRSTTLPALPPKAMLSESDDNRDDDMLSFTPRKSKISRSNSPAPGAIFPICASLAKGPVSLSSDTTGSYPSTPEPEIPNTPPFNCKVDSTLSPIEHVSPINCITDQLITPHYHALREELSNTLKLPSNGIRSFSAPTTGSDAEEETKLPKAVRSTSFEGSSAKFLDARELLRRRRADVTYGMLSSSNSAVGSDEDK